MALNLSRADVPLSSALSHTHSSAPAKSADVNVEQRGETERLTR